MNCRRGSGALRSRGCSCLPALSLPVLAPAPASPGARSAAAAPTGDLRFSVERTGETARGWLAALPTRDDIECLRSVRASACATFARFLFSLLLPHPSALSFSLSLSLLSLAASFARTSSGPFSASSARPSTSCARSCARPYSGSPARSMSDTSRAQRRSNASHSAGCRLWRPCTSSSVAKWSAQKSSYTLNSAACAHATKGG